jgi:hypothetical protein
LRISSVQGIRRFLHTRIRGFFSYLLRRFLRLSVRLHLFKLHSNAQAPRPGTGGGDGAVEDAEEPDDESHHGLRVKARVLLSCWRHSHAHPAARIIIQLA